MKRYLPFVIIAAVAVLTVGGSTMFYRAKQRAYSNRGVSGTPLGKLGAKPRHVRGAPNAPATLEEFGDFQCPACAITSGAIRSLEKDYGPRLRVVFWHFPFATHQHGRDASLAAEAASEQGHFWEMHDLLYKNQPAWSKAADVRALFDEYAANLHLDVQRFKRDFESAQVAARVTADQQLGAARGVKNTPTLFINNRETPPPFTLERLHEAIDAAIAENKKP